MSTCCELDGACPHPVAHVTASGHPLCQHHAVADQAHLIASFSRRMAEEGADLQPLVDHAYAELSKLMAR